MVHYFDMAVGLVSHTSFSEQAMHGDFDIIPSWGQTQVLSVLHDFRHFTIIIDWDTGFNGLRVMLCRTKNICSKIRTFPVWLRNLGSDLEREAGGCADKNFWTKQHACSPFLPYSPSSLTEFEICDEGYLLHTVHHTVHGTAQYMDRMCPHAVICSLSFLFFCTDSVKLKSQSECATSPTDMMPIQQQESH